MSDFKVSMYDTFPRTFEQKEPKKIGLHGIVSSIFKKLSSFFSIENSDQIRVQTKPKMIRSEPFLDKQLPFSDKPVDVEDSILEKNIHGERSILILSPDNYDELSGALRIFPTTGDGSCGFHSLFGIYSPNHRAFHLDNVQEKRSQFADWVKNKFDSNEIPDEIRSSLHDYIKYPKTAPFEIQQILKNDTEITEWAKEFQEANRELKHENAEILLTVLISHPELQSAYLKHLNRRSSYLLPSELGAAAKWAGISINIYQSQSQNGIGDGTVSPPYQYNEGKQKVVDIVLSEKNSHFERAVYTQFS